MTIDDAIRHCEEVADGQTAQGKCPECAEDHRRLAEWLTDYKRLKEQGSCDAISRQAVFDLIEHYNSDGLGSVFYGYEEGVKFADAVNKLPPINPQPKTGHWIDDRCSECGKGIEDLIDSREWYRNEQPTFCPFCGVKLDSQGSEG